MPTLFLTAVLSMAHAEDTSVGTYNDTELARQSTLFAEASKISAPKFATAEGNMATHSKIIQAMEINLALSGLTETPDWYQSNLRYMLGYRQQIAMVVNQLTTAYDTEFTAARDRAIESIEFDGEIKACEAQSIHALMGSAPKCDGVDLNKAIAQKIDADQTLNTALSTINAQEWPSPKVTTDTMEPKSITGSTHYIQLEDFSATMLQGVLQSHQRWLEQQNDSIIEGIESGDPDAIKLAKSQRQEYLARLASDGDKLAQALTIYGAKRAKKTPYLSSLAICVNHRDLGGCSGTDVTSEFITLAKSDKYWLKAQKKSGLTP